jgi:hypothetical protein
MGEGRVREMGEGSAFAEATADKRGRVIDQPSSSHGSLRPDWMSRFEKNILAALKRVRIQSTRWVEERPRSQRRNNRKGRDP